MTEEEFEKLLATDSPQVRYYPQLTPICGYSTEAMLFLSWLIGCLEQSPQPAGWIIKTQQDCFAELGLARKGQESARKKLKAAGLLWEKAAGWPARLCFRINWRRLDLLLRQQAAWGASGWWEARREKK